MVTIKNTNFNDLSALTEMGNQNHVGIFLNTKSLKKHQDNYLQNNVTYLNLINVHGELAGYTILLEENDKKSVQLKRILVDVNNLGIGQNSITEIEKYCISVLKASRIWLDVYEENAKANHVYAKMGYKQFKRNKEGSRTVLFYEKML